MFLYYNFIPYLFSNLFTLSIIHIGFRFNTERCVTISYSYSFWELWRWHGGGAIPPRHATVLRQKPIVACRHESSRRSFVCRNSESRLKASRECLVHKDVHKQFRGCVHPEMRRCLSAHGHLKKASLGGAVTTAARLAPSRRQLKEADGSIRTTLRSPCLSACPSLFFPIFYICLARASDQT